MKKIFLFLLLALVCLMSFHSCKDENSIPGIEEKNGWYSLPTYSFDFLYSVFFANENVGYIVGGGGLIIKTINSGLNWEQQISNTTNSLRSVHFINENKGYSVGDSGIILKTVDGGKNWIIQSSGTVQNLTSTYVTEENTAYVTGKSGVILKTSDGGTNWISQTLGTSNDLNSIWFSDPDIGFIVGDSGTIIKTIDGGENWELNFISVNKDLFSVCFPEDNIGYVIGVRTVLEGEDIILKTTNGGTSWITLESGTFSTLHFVNANVGYLASGTLSTVNATIYKTNDGGGEWNRQSSLAKRISSIFFINENIGFAVGDKTILKTKNGGENE